jgi:hypothetical protein
MYVAFFCFLAVEHPLSALQHGGARPVQAGAPQDEARRGAQVQVSRLSQAVCQGQHAAQSHQRCPSTHPAAAAATQGPEGVHTV